MMGIFSRLFLSMKIMFQGDFFAAGKSFFLSFSSLCPWFKLMMTIFSRFLLFFIFFCVLSGVLGLAWPNSFVLSSSLIPMLRL